MVEKPKSLEMEREENTTSLALLELKSDKGDEE